jgi:hypothetical protein
MLMEKHNKRGTDLFFSLSTFSVKLTPYNHIL